MIVPYKIHIITVTISLSTELELFVFENWKLKIIFHPELKIQNYFFRIENYFSAQNWKLKIENSKFRIISQPRIESSELFLNKELKVQNYFRDSETVFDSTETKLRTFLLCNHAYWRQHDALCTAGTARSLAVRKGVTCCYQRYSTVHEIFYEDLSFLRFQDCVPKSFERSAGLLRQTSRFMT